ncbi:hypothetical protein H2248_004553 [Termitomyces sp. 'cryptogamus']|nr:hypothetical protein H2248_004553 [Termitomyces sp. 'cryptogamus']
MPAMTYRTEAPVPTDIITYRLNSKLVFVRPADDYEQALDYAQKEFPDELAELDRSRISFYINAKMNGDRLQSVRISASAWPAAVSRLLRGEVIDVCVYTPPTVRHSDSKDVAPPQYLEVPQLYHSTSVPSSPRRRSPSPSCSVHSEKTKRSWFPRLSQ